jgi:hypothetical protein
VCNIRLSKFNASFTHLSIGCIALDVVAFIPDPRVGFANTLGPRPAWELAENVVFVRRDLAYCKPATGVMHIPKKQGSRRLTGPLK